MFAATSAQTKMPVQLDNPIGAFSLNDVHYYSKKSVTNKDFKGKWLILDFWNQGCINCLKSMPKMNQMQAHYKDSLQIIMVGYTGSQYHPATPIPDDQTIRKLYEINRKSEKLNLTVAYDSTLFHRYDIGGCPYLIVINPKGIIKAITTRITRQQIDSLRNNFAVHLKEAYTRSQYREVVKKRAKEMKQFNP
eukprot:gene21769-25834_t